MMPLLPRLRFPEPRIKEGLVLWLRFDEGTGNKAFDSSPYANNGTIYGATWTDGRFGKALEFDGVDDYVEITYSSSLDVLDGNSPFTFEAWVKPLSDIPPATSNVIFSQKDGTGVGRSWIYIHTDGKWKSYLGAVETSSTVTAEKGKFTHVVLRYDGTTLQFFIDGSPAGYESVTVDENANGNYLLGVAKDFTAPFKGIIDEVRIWNRALTLQEIKFLYHRGLLLRKLESSGIVLSFPFTEARGTKLYDRSGYGNHGTIYGATWVFDPDRRRPCLSFDGVDDYVDIGDKLDPHTSDWSIVTWIKTEMSSSIALRGIITKNPHGGDGRWGLYYKYGKVSGFLSDSSLGGDKWAHGSSYVNDGNWHFIVVTYDRDGNMTIYVDGVKEGEVDISASNGVDFDIDTHLVIGASVGGSDYYFNGLIGEVRIWNCALTEAEIRARYRGGRL